MCYDTIFHAFIFFYKKALKILKQTIGNMKYKGWKYALLSDFIATLMA